MTANQVAYLRLREESRANRAKEAENRRANLELQRSNLAKEAEANRHNVKAESLERLGYAYQDTWEANKVKAKVLTEGAKSIGKLLVVGMGS